MGLKNLKVNYKINIISLITILEEEESKCSNSFDDISTKIMLKNILNRLNEIEYLAKQNNIKDKKC